MHHLLTLDTIAPAEIEHLCQQARLLKHARGTMTTAPLPLAGCTIALLFEKPSLRTRVSFEIAAHELGAHCLYLSPQEVGLNKRESVGDVARVLSSYVHCIVLRTFDHAILKEFASAATVPVINGLTDEHHPCQGLTDVFTIMEQCGRRHDLTVTYLGDGNNCAHSLLQAAAKLGMHVRIATPPDFMPDPAIIEQARHEAAQAGGSITLLTDPIAAATDADVLYTDVWVSMGQEAHADQRREPFIPYRVNDQLLAVARPEAIVLHPLPAHRNDEIIDSVIDGAHSRVFVQAENRLHMQKAILRTLVAVRQLACMTA